MIADYLFGPSCIMFYLFTPVRDILKSSEPFLCTLFVRCEIGDRNFVATENCKFRRKTKIFCKSKLSQDKSVSQVCVCVLS